MGGGLEASLGRVESHKLMHSGLEIISEESEVFTETVLGSNMDAKRTRELDSRFEDFQGDQSIDQM